MRVCINYILIRYINQLYTIFRLYSPKCLSLSIYVSMCVRACVYSWVVYSYVQNYQRMCVCRSVCMFVCMYTPQCVCFCDYVCECMHLQFSERVCLRVILTLFV